MPLILILLLSAVAWGHTGEPAAPHDVWTAWTFDVLVVGPLLVTAYLFGRGRGATTGQRISFWAGWIALTGALISPVHAVGEALFSAHMLQHEVLMLVAAPLLAYSRPLVPMLFSLPMEWRRKIGGVGERLRWVATPWVAWLVHFVALWAWHWPSLFDASVRHDWVHALQHFSFVGSALLFWWSLMRKQSEYGMAVLYLFSTCIHNTALGFLLAFSPDAWYRAYAGRTEAWGLSMVEDQQIGGLIMLVPSGVVYIAVAMVLMAGWMQASDRALRWSERLHAD